MTCGLLWLLSFPGHVSEAHPHSGGWGSWGRGASLLSRPCSVVSCHGDAPHFGDPCFCLCTCLGAVSTFGNCQECCCGHSFLGRAPTTAALGYTRLCVSPAEEASTCFPRGRASSWGPGRPKTAEAPVTFLSFSCVIMLVLLGVGWHRLSWFGVAFPWRGFSLCSLVTCLSLTPSRTPGSRRKWNQVSRLQAALSMEPPQEFGKMPFGTFRGWDLPFFVIKFTRVQRMGFLVYCQYQLLSLKQFLAL